MVPPFIFLKNNVLLTVFFSLCKMALMFVLEAFFRYFSEIAVPGSDAFFF